MILNFCRLECPSNWKEMSTNFSSSRIDVPLAKDTLSFLPVGCGSNCYLFIVTRDGNEWELNGWTTSWCLLNFVRAVPQHRSRVFPFLSGYIYPCLSPSRLSDADASARHGACARRVTVFRSTGDCKYRKRRLKERVTDRWSRIYPICDSRDTVRECLTTVTRTGFALPLQRTNERDFWDVLCLATETHEIRAGRHVQLQDAYGSVEQAFRQGIDVGLTADEIRGRSTGLWNIHGGYIAEEDNADFGLWRRSVKRRNGGGLPAPQKAGHTYGVRPSQYWSDNSGAHFRCPHNFSPENTDLEPICKVRYSALTGNALSSAWEELRVP